MKTHIIFVGNIRRVTNHRISEPKFVGNAIITRYKTESEPYKDKATLIKITDSKYLDINSISSILYLLKIKCYLLVKKSLENEKLVMDDHTHLSQPVGTLYVDHTSLTEPSHLLGHTLSFRKK